MKLISLLKLVAILFGISFGLSGIHAILENFLGDNSPQTKQIEFGKLYAQTAYYCQCSCSYTCNDGNKSDSYLANLGRYNGYNVQQAVNYYSPNCNSRCQGTVSVSCMNHNGGNYNYYVSCN